MLALTVLSISSLLKISDVIFGNNHYSFVRYVAVNIIKKSKIYLVTIFVFFQMVSQVLIEVTIYNMQKIISKWSFYLRCLFCLWLLTSSSVVTYLKVLQTSNYINANPFHPSGVDDLVRVGFKFQVNHNSIISENFLFQLKR